MSGKVLLDLYSHRMIESNQINRGSTVIGFIIKSMQDDNEWNTLVFIVSDKWSVYHLFMEEK